MIGTSPRLAPPAAEGWLSAHGPFFQDEKGARHFLRGVTYGPFAPNSSGESWPEPDRLADDLAHIAELGFNTLRVYGVPSETLLEACGRHHLRLLVSVPWTQHVDFRQDRGVQQEARENVRSLARRFRDDPRVVGFLVGNEFDKTLVRWMTPRWTQEFIEGLIEIARQEAPQKLISYASYPSTEFLIPRNADFVAFNVFLEQPTEFAAYLRHLQVLAEGRPLLISEFGLDTRQHGEAAQADAGRWFHEECRRQGIAGHCWFSYTDEWFNGGAGVADWEFGLVTSDRQEKTSCAAVKECLVTGTQTPQGTDSDLRFSVVVCTRNGAATLKPCLEALSKQTWRNCEVIVIDDGSTDGSAVIARSFPEVRYARQDFAGLSAARNWGAKLAGGQVIAYTDDDCLPDENWLANLAPAFADAQVAAAGGPNLPPRPRTGVESIVAAAPGAPSHVLLNDLEAEHLPGCNLAIRKTALDAIGGFREEFRTAGDDVDICWRLRAAGGVLRFVPQAFVWHHRRATVSAYLRQQRGYGRAEALLMRHWPQHFAWMGGARWRGLIYGPAQSSARGLAAFVDRGRFGAALFPTIYAGHSPVEKSILTGLPCFALVLTAVLAGVFYHPFLCLALALAIASFLIALQSARNQRRAVAQPLGCQGQLLLVGLHWLQPVWRDMARLLEMIRLRVRPKGTDRNDFPTGYAAAKIAVPRWRQVRAFWSEGGVEREALLKSLAESALRHGTSLRADDTGAVDYWLTTGRRRLALLTVTEYHERNRRLTRVALGSAGFLGNLGMAVPLAVLALVMLPLNLALLAFVVLSAFEALRSRWHRSQILALIDAAARRSGLHPLPPAKAEGIALAPPRAPAEMLES